MLYILILAGGPGTRLWPLCRNDRPKQFLKFPAQESLLLQAINRAKDIVPVERIYISTKERYAEPIFAEVPDFPRNQVILEPYRRDTGPAVALVVSHLLDFDPSATLAVLTTDHLISDSRAFGTCLQTASNLAHNRSVAVTFGIPPTRPETGYGYLEAGEAINLGEPKVWNLQSFKEKPDQKSAESYLAQGNYFWNSGMFVWKVSVIAELFAEHTPEIWAGAQRISSAGFAASHFAADYAALPAISVDRAIMEKVKTGFIVEATFSWEDIGSWRSFANHRHQDENENAFSGRTALCDTTGCLFEVSGKLLAGIGLHDLVVVDTPDVLFICPKDRDQEVKKLLQKMQDEGLEEFL